MKKNKGITLIALVITIVIMLILAGITLNAALGENGLIERAKKAAATYKKAEEDESKGIEQLIDEMDKVNGGNGETAPSPEPTETTEPTSEPTPSPDPTLDPTPTPEVSADKLNDKVNSGNEGAGSVLGKKVEGLSLANGLSYEWQIFDVDANHIWLISKDYIQVADCPQTKNGKTVPTTYSYKGVLTNVRADYTGATNVSADLQPLNSKFFNHSICKANTCDNAKMMAYLLDKDIWTAKFIGEASKNKVDYVIGCPTIEQIVAVNNKKHSDSQLELQIKSNNIGYEIKKASGSWSNALIGALQTTDSELVITDTSKSSAMWVASPSANNVNIVMGVYCSGIVGNYGYNSNNGFRPVVSLKSTVHLEDTGSGYTIK